MVKQICSVSGCEKRVTAKGFCLSHYRRNRDHGSPFGGRAFNGQPYRWLMETLSMETDDCIIWPFSKSKSGYPQLKINGETKYATRIVLEAHQGVIKGQENLYAAHKPIICHNPSCINKRHLRWASPSENCADKILDKTSRAGEDCYLSKLSEAQVLLVIKDKRKQKLIADEYNISQATVSDIKRGKSWKQLSR